MSATGSAKAPDANDQDSPDRSSNLSPERPAIAPWFHTWKQVVIAELLNLLERRRID